ncbi:unnamed protein product [Cuscuta epithymum]|uniref:Leucine-rich repeat-containing N-terminal plant-type domain-containing protein n=1 Tax=Cuscuta epithymum TaxID=186058 RepID=A0AAV0DRX2_9ASTE|nr:unnamed protein product [Cuscuta epithymum]
MEMKKCGKVLWDDQVHSSSSSRLLQLLLLAAAFPVSTMAGDIYLTDHDVNVMMDLKGHLTFSNESVWADHDPCNWEGVGCEIVTTTPDEKNLAVSWIAIPGMNVSGRLPASLGNLTQLFWFEASYNSLTGPLPDFAGTPNLSTLAVDHNRFTSIPPTLFFNKTKLRILHLDYNFFLGPWEIPQDLRFYLDLMNFSAVNCNIHGDFPSFFNGDNFPTLVHLHLAHNHLSGQLPPILPLSLVSLWLNNQTRADGSSSLSGTISAIQNLTLITQLYLHGNNFSGQIPDVSGLPRLTEFTVSYNSLTGPVPKSLAEIPSLKQVNLSNNNLNGSVPHFSDNVTLITCGNPGLADQKGLPC